MKGTSNIIYAPGFNSESIINQQISSEPVFALNIKRRRYCEHEPKNTSCKQITSSVGSD
jgi:hypothetical protein